MNAESMLTEQEATNPLKIVFVGNVGSGKTTAVSLISEVPVIGSEAKETVKVFGLPSLYNILINKAL